MFAMFKKATGLSPNDYLQRHRIECAREQLRRDEVSITDVALSTGFESSQYFSRVFRKYCGITPTEFREQGCAS
jgi:AraC-like DNA-binding protein